MIDVERIFKNRTLNEKKLLGFGFVPAENGYICSFDLPNGQFEMIVLISDAGRVSVKVMDAESGEEYVLIHTKEAKGEFVGLVINACEDRLSVIAESCFDYEVFKNIQTKQIIEHVKNTYQDEPEFLWAKFPNNAVFRRKDTGKWYAAVLTVAREKLGLEGEGRVEIIDLRAIPDEIIKIVDGRYYFPGYHMNKKHWYTICLDGSLCFDELCRRIGESYSLAVK